MGKAAKGNMLPSSACQPDLLASLIFLSHGLVLLLHDISRTYLQSHPTAALVPAAQRYKVFGYQHVFVQHKTISILLISDR